MTKKKSMLRDWPDEQLESLIDLLDEIRRPPEPTNALHSLYANRDAQLSARQRDNVEQEWARIESHPLWKNLSRDKCLSDLRAKFRRNRARFAQPILPRDEFTLLYVSLLAALYYASWDRKRLRKGAEIADHGLREKALAATRNLIAIRNQGVSLPDPREDEQLGLLLLKLRRQIEDVSRKKHEHTKIREVDSLGWFTWLMRREFGDTSQTVLKAFASFADIDLDDSTIGRVLKRERQN